MKRRQFLKTATCAAGLAASPGMLAGLAQAAQAQSSQDKRSGVGAEPPTAAPVAETRVGDMLYRTLGRTGERVSALGLGGYHIGMQANERESLKIIRTAVDRGITFLDNCWDYHDGGSEERMGQALQDGYRAKVFLMTKIDGRTREAAAKQIDESLRRLQTEHVDLLQHHEVLRFEDPDRIFAEDGAHEAMLAAQKAGKIRYIGFTGHKDPLVHLRMLDMADQHDFHFDTVQMPLNVMDAHFRSFGHQVLPRLLRDGIAALGMKPIGSGAILESGAVQATECLRYALGLGTSVVITGIDNLKVLDQNLDLMKNFKPYTAAEVADLLSRTASFAATGRYERFKTSANFDGTARHPEWLG